MVFGLANLATGLRYLDYLHYSYLHFLVLWKKKLWFIPLGIFIVHTANAIRIAALTIISAENPKALDFNHNITFQVIVYGLIFLLWYWWVQKLSGITQTEIK